MLAGGTRFGADFFCAAPRRHPLGPPRDLLFTSLRVGPAVAAGPKKNRQIIPHLGGRRIIQSSCRVKKNADGVASMDLNGRSIAMARTSHYCLEDDHERRRLAQLIPPRPR